MMTTEDKRSFFENFSMDPALVLLLLRLVSASLLLAFLALTIWLISRDTRMTSELLMAQGGNRIRLQVIACDEKAELIGTRYALGPVTSIGRDTGNTIVLDDDYASSRHALITRRGEMWWLEDLGSSNGMLLNEIPLEEAAVVSSGDVITIGGTKLQFEF